MFVKYIRCHRGIQVKCKSKVRENLNYDSISVKILKCQLDICNHRICFNFVRKQSLLETTAFIKENQLQRLQFWHSNKSNIFMIMKYCKQFETLENDDADSINTFSNIWWISVANKPTKMKNYITKRVNVFYNRKHKFGDIFEQLFYIVWITWIKWTFAKGQLFSMYFEIF